MRYLALLLLVICSSLKSNAQNDAVTQQFIKSALREPSRFIKGLLNEQKIIYVDRLDPGMIDRIKQDINKYETYKKTSNVNHNRSLPGITFSKAERIFIINQLDKSKRHIWKKGLIENSFLLNHDTLQKIYDTHPVSIDKESFWQFFNKHYGKVFYEFSKPVFIRDQTICIFYIAYHCGEMCGRGELSIYIKGENKWKKVDSLLDWIS
ncbi:MAG TPA: hypothetical protein VK668_14795 [Mucilaginibacter sp.]|nr:hypothetical protein [Mucilaginibacter sp.]